MKKLKKFMGHVYRKLTRPKVLRKKITNGDMTPRISSIPYCSIVKTISGCDDVIFSEILSNKETIFNDFKPNDKVLIKLNLNTADPFPASIDKEMLVVIINSLKAIGIKDIGLGDCSSIRYLPTRKIFAQKELNSILTDTIKPIFFDEEQWVNVPIKGQYLKQITIPKSIYDYDKIIYLANLKTHWTTDFTMSMKLAVGFMHPIERHALHKENIHEKIAEISLAVTPDLIFLDSRKPFITGGPARGESVNGDSVLIGSDLLSVDLAGYKLLYDLKEKNNCLGEFTLDPFDMKQFSHMKEISLGGKSERISDWCTKL